MRASARAGRLAGCGCPSGCSAVATHEVVDPVWGGVFAACDDHWPDLAATIFAQGGWVTGCPCPECTGS